MIRNQWYAVLESDEVRPGKPLGVTRMGEKMVFWRDADGYVTCMADLCPHRGVALSAGKLVGHHIECPFHGFQFDASGQGVLIPANGRGAPVPKAFSVRTYPAREAFDFIWIWWGSNAPEDLEPPRFFDNLTPDFSYGSQPDPWQAVTIGKQ